MEDKDLPEVVVTIPRLGSDDAGGHAVIHVSVEVDGVSYDGVASLRGRTTAPFTKRVALRRTGPF